jgi:hypothetical protein
MLSPQNSRHARPLHLPIGRLSRSTVTPVSSKRRLKDACEELRRQCRIIIVQPSASQSQWTSKRLFKLVLLLNCVEKALKPAMPKARMPSQFKIADVDVPHNDKHRDREVSVTCLVWAQPRKPVLHVQYY